MNCNSISANELLARFIVYKRWLREDQTVKQEAFIPYPALELSVTRHLNLSEEEIWKYGKLAAGDPPRKLRGRADIKVSHVWNEGLRVVIAPVRNNPNHANITNWPQAKDAQKIRALSLASAAKFIAQHII